MSRGNQTKHEHLQQEGVGDVERTRPVRQQCQQSLEFEWRLEGVWKGLDGGGGSWTAEDQGGTRVCPRYRKRIYRTRNNRLRSKSELGSLRSDSGGLSIECDETCAFVDTEHETVGVAE